MKTKMIKAIKAKGLKVLSLFAFVLFISFSGNAQDKEGEKETGAGMGLSKVKASEVIKGWPGESQKVAEQLIQKYGEPKEITENMLVWEKTGPYIKTVITKDPIPHHFPMKHMDVMKQEIYYEVPIDKVDDLLEYDGSLIIERTKGTLGVRCDKEEANFIALNLANDIVTGKKNVKEARKAYADLIKQLMNGENPAYAQKLQFDVKKGKTGFTDKPAEGM